MYERDLNEIDARDSTGGARLYPVTGYAFSERGPLVPVTGGTANPGSFPVQIDASGAFAYAIGEGPQLDGLVEVSIDDASFASPRAATLTNVTSEARWQLIFFAHFA